MKATFIITLSVATIVSLEIPEPKDSQHEEKTPIPTPPRELPLDAWDGTFSHNSLFSHFSSSGLSQGLADGDIIADNRQHPKHVTRLRKPYFPGLDPHFDQGFFQPLERRPKPVTLIGIRKNGVFPRKTMLLNEKPESSDVAELQSPYNDISNFWLDEPGRAYQ